MDTHALIASAPAELLLGLGILFCAAGIILLALATEAGHYPEFRQWLELARALPRRRLRRRWLFNTGLAKGATTKLAS